MREIGLPVTVKLVLHREKSMASTKYFEERGQENVANRWRDATVQAVVPPIIK
jgi:hypothetical protein